MVQIRHAEPADHGPALAVVDDWWGGRSMAPMLQRLFFVHFRETSFVAEDAAGLAGFLCGFLSQTFPDEAYIHFVGVRPDRRRDGLGRELYERFFVAARAAGRTIVRCITSPVNESSVAFHTRLGFESTIVENYDAPGEHRVTFVKNLS
jgi:ribosomal protein S18 acetylase RimI-like enzyme